MQLFSSYYDLEADKALPISSLVARFEQEGNAQVKAVSDEDTPAFTAAQWKGVRLLLSKLFKEIFVK
jgi:leucyl-tRNA synthetase